MGVVGYSLGYSHSTRVVEFRCPLWGVMGVGSGVLVVKPLVLSVIRLFVTTQRPTVTESTVFDSS